MNQDRLELEDVNQALLSTVEDTLQPSQASLWLREQPEAEQYRSALSLRSRGNRWTVLM
jgi:hypothetical protein